MVKCSELPLPGCSGATQLFFSNEVLYLDVFWLLLVGSSLRCLCRAGREGRMEKEWQQLGKDKC